MSLAFCKLRPFIIYVLKASCVYAPQGEAGGGAKQGEGAEAESAERTAARAGQQY